MDIHAILDQLDEIIYISDPKSYELLYLNRRGRAIFGAIAAGAKCYEHLQGASEPCVFCTNEILRHSPDHRHTWVRRHPAVGTMLLHDSLVEYAGRLCRMEEAIDINRYIAKDFIHDMKQSIHEINRKLWLEEREKQLEYLNLLMDEYRESKFVPYLQPLYSIKNSEVYGAEVLVRKIDSEGNILVPVEFIRMMEREQIVSLVDYEMLRQSCELLVKWREEWSNLVLNVNFSRVTIHEPDCVVRVDEILRETGADPKQIIIEITESSQDMQFERMAERLSELKSRGFSIALDDMGTEAACLEMLYLPQLDIIKIDRSLICRSVNSEREKIVIEGLIDLCHRLGMTCVAEGIETEEQVELLKQLNCDRLQGYHIGKPMPAGEFFKRFKPRNLGDARGKTRGDGEYSRETT